MGFDDPVQTFKPTGVSTGVKEVEKSSNPFESAAEVDTKPQTTFSIGEEGKDSNRDAFVNQRLKDLAGKTAISSEDFLQNNDSEHQERL